MEMNEKIKNLRLSRKMTLEDVGNIVGVGKSTVRKWENGDIKNMRRDKIAKLAQALETTPAYLMGWDEKNNEAAPKDGKETKFVKLFSQLTHDEQLETLNYIEYLISKR